MTQSFVAVQLAAEFSDSATSNDGALLVLPAAYLELAYSKWMDIVKVIFNFTKKNFLV